MSGCSQIDIFFNGFSGGDLVIINLYEAEKFFYLFLYHISRQVYRRNFQNIPHFENLQRNIFNDFNKYKDNPIWEKIYLDDFFDELFCFNILTKLRNDFYDKYFEYITKLAYLFRELPFYLCNDTLNPLNVSARRIVDKGIKLFGKKNISTLVLHNRGFSKDIIAACKELAVTLDIPIFLVDMSPVRVNELRKIKHFNKCVQYADKFLFAERDSGEGYRFLCYDISKRSASQFTINWDVPLPFSEIPEIGNKIIQADSLKCLQTMLQDSNYINKTNFSTYMDLSNKENKSFWAYFEVFGYIKFENLYQHIEDYKKGKADEHELILATTVLFRLLTNDYCGDIVTILKKEKTAQV